MLLYKIVIIILQCYFTLYVLVLFFLKSLENAVKGDERITRAVGLCKKLVGHFSHTWKGKMALKKAQKEHNLPEQSLITECPTRWGSRQRMIQRVLEQQRAISDVLSADRESRHLVSSWQDLEVLESINQALQPLQEFTDALSGESYVSVSYVKPVLHLMNTSILAAKEEHKVHKDEDSRVHEHQVWQPCNSRTSGHDLLYGPQIQSRLHQLWQGVRHQSQGDVWNWSNCATGKC